MPGLQRMREASSRSAIVLWNTVCIPLSASRVVDRLRAEGHELPDDIIRYISPQIWEHINLTGIYDWMSEPRPKGTFRPLRVANERMKNTA
jgi:predicted ABC-type ATPase